MSPLSSKPTWFSPTEVNTRAGDVHSTVTTKAEATAPGGTVGCLTKGDIALMAFGCGLTLLVSFLLSYRRIFWEDEMLGWMLLRDPSWHHMIQAWNMGADGGGFLFYLTGRSWFSIFGASEISFRMYSATCFGLAFCILWLTLRSFYRTNVVAFALFNTWFFSQTIVTHLAEGRFYGLLMFFTALVVWLVVAGVPCGRTTHSQYAMYFIANAGLVTSHLLGILYSATLLTSLALLDRYAHRSRWKLYATIVSTWLLILPERTAILATAQVGKPHFWTTQPGLSRWLGAYSAYSIEVAFTLVVVSVAALFSMRRRRGGLRVRLKQAFETRRPAYIITAALLLVPVELFLEGLVGPSLFINRYLLPVAIAQAFVTAEALSLIDWRAFSFTQSTSAVVRGLAVTGFLVILFSWDLRHLAGAVMARKNYTDALTARLPRDLPVLCEDAWDFTEIIGRQHSSGVQYTYLLDWDQSISSSAPRLEVTQYHLMENWKKVGYFAGSIQYRAPFLEKNSRFLIFHQEPGPGASYPPFIGNPLLDRFRSDPGYQVVPFRSSSVTHDQELWLVCRRSC